MASRRYVISFHEDDLVRQSRITRHHNYTGTLEKDRVLPKEWTRAVHKFYWYTRYPDYGPDFSESYAERIMDDLLDMPDEDIERWILMYSLSGGE